MLHEDLALLQAVHTGGELEAEGGFLGVGQEGDPGGWYKEEGPGDHWLIWLPPRRQDTEDFQLLLRLKLMMERRGKSQGSTPFSPGPDFQTQNDTLLALPPATQPSASPSWKND